MIETLVDGLGFVEGLRRHDGRTWFSDFSARRVYSFGGYNVLRTEAYVPGQPSGLGFAPAGGVLVVSVHEGRILRYENSSCTLIADIGAIYRGGLNDMLTTAAGQSYVSAFPAPPVGDVIADVPADGGQVPLFFVSAKGEARVVAEGLKIPNGIAQSVDGRELFVAETMARRILVFSILPDGSLSNQRTFADLGHRMPDGLSMDRQGRLWFGSPFSSEFVRLDTSGAIDEIVPTPGRWAVSCAVGDNDDELYCGTVRTTIEDYKQGQASGSIERWSRG